MRKTQEEIDAMSPAELKAYKRQQQDIVYGGDCPRDARGRPVEQGFGSALHPTRNHVEAIRNNIRHGVLKDPDGSILEKAEKDLAAYEAKHRGHSDEDDEGDPAAPAIGRIIPERFTKRRGNPAGLVKARAAAKAKRAALAAAPASA